MHKRYKINEKIGIHFFPSNCGFRKERGNSIRDIKCVINEDGKIKIYELCEEDELSKEELNAIFKKKMK